MFRKSQPADWMWAHALELMDRAERMQRQFFRLSSAEPSHAVWEPPADVFEDEREVVVIVALPGVTADRVEVTMEPGSVAVRAERPLPYAASRRAIHQLEIPHGLFQRRIAIPDAPLEFATQELSHGCLVLRMRKAG
jgi:HSP20 family protein